MYSMCLPSSVYSFFSFKAVRYDKGLHKTKKQIKQILCSSPSPVAFGHVQLKGFYCFAASHGMCHVSIFSDQ